MKRVYLLFAAVLFTGIVAAQSTAQNQATSDNSSTKVQLKNVAEYKGPKPQKCDPSVKPQKISDNGNIRKKSQKSAQSQEQAPLNGVLPAKTEKTQGQKSSK